MHYWILVADAARARLYSTDSEHGPFRLERKIENPPGRARPQELLSDQPGRYAKGGKRGILSAMEFATPWHQVEEQRFANHLAELLRKALARREYDALAIIAAAQLLGRLRAAIGPQVQKHLVKSIAKDLTTFTDHELPERIAAELAPTP
jgi:protein required for attachment to host cells